MPSPKNALLIVVSLALVGTSALAWYQYNQLLSLRANLATVDSTLSAKWQSRVAELESRLSEKEKAAPESEAAAPEDAAPERGRGFGNARWRERMEAMQKVMSSPEFQKLAQLRTAGFIENRYASLFKQLQLPPQALQQFKSLLAEKQNALQDVMASARAEGMAGPQNRDAVRAMIAQTQAEVDANIQSTIGDAAFNQYKQFEQTLPQQSTVNELAQRLSYTSSPLTDSQAQQLVNILASTSNQNQSGNATGGMNNRAVMAVATGMPVPPASVSSTAITQAQGVLSADQLAALQQIQAEQQAQRQMQQLMRDTFRNSGTTAPAQRTTTPKTGGGG